MTFNDIKAILKKLDMRFSYEVNDQEEITTIYVEESGITADSKAEYLSKLMPDFHVNNMSNLNYIQITWKKSTSVESSH
jgi:hypothetical protein